MVALLAALQLAEPDRRTRDVQRRRRREPPQRHGIYLAGDTIDIAAAALAILYVRRVTARQRLRAELREAAASITQ